MIEMDKWCLLLPASGKRAMNEGVADVEEHVQHCIDNDGVFWDRNKPVPLDEQRRIEGGYLYLAESGIVRTRFTIVRCFDGHENYENLINSPVYRRHFTPDRIYSGENYHAVMDGEKCGTFLLLKDPQSVGPYETSDFTLAKDGRPVRGAVQGTGKYVRSME